MTKGTRSSNYIQSMDAIIKQGNFQTFQNEDTDELAISKRQPDSFHKKSFWPHLAQLFDVVKEVRFDVFGHKPRARLEPL